MLRVLKRLYQKLRLYREKRMVIGHKHDALEIMASTKDFRRKGFSMSESQIYQLGKNDYRDYINTWESYQPRIARNVPYSSISDDKLLFFLTFGHFIKTPEVFGVIREGRVISIGSSHLPEEPDAIYDFFKEHGGGVIKDASGSDGFNVFVFAYENGDLLYKGQKVNHESFLKTIDSIKYGLIQEKISQGQFENSIYSKSINTIRVISIKGEDGKHEIVAAAQRIGTDRSFPVDNFNQGGLSALIDLETGILGKATSIFSLNDHGDYVFFDRHPDTGAIIEGSVVPNWKELRSIIEKLTTIFPFFDYLAWDFVVQDDGFALIEINLKSSLNVFQIHRGMRGETIGRIYLEKGYIKDV